jgi:BirA family transcriptional regulator, biotin operon repressor / biotin---[acetyl-CoA-carboxylase] ligase
VDIVKLLQNLVSEIHYLPSTSSTNSFLEKLDAPRFPAVCIAEKQTAGRGRRGKVWQSPENCNIYLSLMVETNRPIIEPSIALVAGISVVNVLKNLFLLNDLGIKWPNDIFYHGKKLAGILVEKHPKKDALIIGIGINVNQENNTVIDQPWTSLLHIKQKKCNREIIIKPLIQDLLTALEQHQNLGFSPFMPLWNKFDLLKNQKITLCDNRQCYNGLAQGVTENGGLVLKDNKGNLQKYYSGSVSIRNNKIN